MLYTRIQPDDEGMQKHEMVKDTQIEVNKNLSIYQADARCSHCQSRFLHASLTMQSTAHKVTEMDYAKSNEIKNLILPLRTLFKLHFPSVFILAKLSTISIGGS